MYRQGNGITGHYSLFLRKSRYSGSRACTDQQQPFSRSWECSFHTLSSPPFLSAFSSFSSFSFSLFFYFVLLAPFTTSNSIPMNRSEELEGRSWFNDDTPFRGGYVGTGGVEKKKEKRGTLDSGRWNNRFRLHSICHGKQRYELSSFFYQHHRLNLGNGLT